MSNQQLKTAVTGKEESLHPYAQLDRQLEMSRGEFAKLLGKEIQVDRFIRTVKNAVLSNPELLDADRPSLIAAAMKAATDQLIPDGREAVFNIYNTKKKVDGREVWFKLVQYLPMVQGMIKRLYQSGHVIYVDAAAVYEADEFSWERGDNPRIVHKPSPAEEPGPLIAAYAVFKLSNGEVKREVMFARDVAKVRAASKASTGPGWTTWEDQFAIKSVIKRGYKQLPYHPAIESIVESDNLAMGFTAIPAATPAALEEKAPSTLAGMGMGQQAEPVNAAPAATTEAPAKGPATDDDVRRMRLADFITVLDDYKSIEEIEARSNEAPEWVRGDADYAKAVKKALDRVKGKA